MPRDYTRLMAELADAYRSHAPRSAALNERAQQVMVDGGSHALRLMEPFPPRIVRAKGARVWDEDGHGILDFWQGHFANILGHNPEVVTSAVAQALDEGFGLQTGFTDRLQIETAELLCRRTGAERCRFTTSGSLATMYAIMLARAATGRDLVMKVGGGWHGAQPWGLVGVSFQPGRGFQHLETQGLPPAIGEQVVVTRYNDPQMLCDHFQQFGDRLACFIVEPFMGSGGGIPARREYLHTARRLADQYGVVLIFDEVIAGFRFRAGDLGSLYGVRPDLATFGKIIGGGMPVTAVAGRAAIMNLAGRAGGSKVKFSGGTYSSHPASLLAAKTLMAYLVEHEAEVYPRLAELGDMARHTAEDAFTSAGIYARCTGYSDEVQPGTSMVNLHFPLDADHELERPEDVLDPEVCDPVLSEHVLRLALLVENVHTTHGLGSLSTAHTAADIDELGAACHRVAERIKPYLAQHTKS
jgi:glutamate-1-semialdehyde 2,1-aminomutase